jgi:hypothetical protein
MKLIVFHGEGTYDLLLGWLANLPLSWFVFWTWLRPLCTVCVHALLFLPSSVDDRAGNAEIHATAHLRQALIQPHTMALSGTQRHAGSTIGGACHLQVSLCNTYTAENNQYCDPTNLSLPCQCGQNAHTEQTKDYNDKGLMRTQGMSIQY